MLDRPFSLSRCPKAQGIDKAISPEETIRHVTERLCRVAGDVLDKNIRIDTGRLGIPVFMSVYGETARKITPAGKQMGKGTTPALARASAAMELVERFSFFSFWENLAAGDAPMPWKAARKKFGDAVLPVEQVVNSVGDSMPGDIAETLLDLVPWHFCPAYRLEDCRRVLVPFDWFKQINEFNGASAGNRPEESIMQGLCELIERHVCNRIMQERPQLADIDMSASGNPALSALAGSFRREGIRLVLKDFSLGMPAPTVGAVAWDPATFPEKSEIVFTAGTASSPAGAAIRAITEVAQLGGDFCTGSCYQASGLPKLTDPEQIRWLENGCAVPLERLPDISSDDIYLELKAIVEKISPYEVYVVETTHPDLQIPAHYTIVPGFGFRERDICQSLGLFIGRRISESMDGTEAMRRLDTVQRYYPNAHFIPFFRGMVALRGGDAATAKSFFLNDSCLGAPAEAAAMAHFYAGYADWLSHGWQDAIPNLKKSVQFSPHTKEYHNLLGVCYFRTGQYEAAIPCFESAIKIDKGSAFDHANIGICYERIGNSEKAAEHLRLALLLDPGIDQARSHLERLAKT